MLFLLVILFFAALPVIAVFVFLEVHAAKQQSSGINDRYRKLAKIMGWVLVVGILLLFACAAYHSWLEGNNLRKFWPALLVMTVVLLKLFTTTKR